MLRRKLQPLEASREQDARRLSCATDGEAAALSPSEQRRRHVAVYRQGMREVLDEALAAFSEILAEAEAAEDGETMQLEIVCPDGCGAGDTLTVQTPAGEAQVQIPAGVKAGEAFTLQLQLGADGDGGGEGAE